MIIKTLMSNYLNYSSVNSTASNDINCNLSKHINEPMRILIFNESFYPYTSGISRRFIEIITRLARRSFKVHVLTGSKVC
jgi:hypothetical protein